MFNWLMMFWFMLRLLFCWFTKFKLLSFWLLLLLFRLLAMLATVLQMGNWFGLVKTTVFRLHMGKKTNKKKTRGTFTCHLIVNLKMETAMERKAIWERDTALESAVEGHCSPPEKKARSLLLHMLQLN